MQLKNLVTLSLLLLFINSNTEFHELLRLPILIEHFIEHKNKSQDLSFVDFLTMHYKTKTAHDKDDNSLPFKNAAHACMTTALTICETPVVLTRTFFLTEVQHSSIYRESFFPSPLNKIFQPPRIG